MTTSVQGRIRRSVRYSSFDMKGDHRVQQGNLRRERISCSDRMKELPYQQTQDWVNGVGMSPSGRFQVIEEAKPRQRLFSAEGIRWDAARALLILCAAIMAAVLLALTAGIGASGIQIKRLQDRIAAAEQRNADLRAELALSAADISVLTEAVKLNLISSTGARTVTLTAPQDAGMLPVESGNDAENGLELRGAADTN